MQTFRVDLKTLLGLVLPNQRCHVVVRKNRGRFLGYIISQIALTPSMSLIYSTIVLYDMYIHAAQKHIDTDMLLHMNWYIKEADFITLHACMHTQLHTLYYTHTCTHTLHARMHTYTHTTNTHKAIHTFLYTVEKPTALWSIILGYMVAIGLVVSPTPRK